MCIRDRSWHSGVASERRLTLRELHDEFAGGNLRPVNRPSKSAHSSDVNVATAFVEQAGDVDWTEVDADSRRRVAAVDDADYCRRHGLDEYQLPLHRLLTR